MNAWETIEGCYPTVQVRRDSMGSIVAVSVTGDGLTRVDVQVDSIHYDQFSTDPVLRVSVNGHKI